ncbi:MAG: Gfo/Idh/MocA family oxidoreductase [Calditrichaeota bacterium]|nr:Gfo/Idh/MocA family oxidoreductase [Calditrichota bacterium]
MSDQKIRIGIVGAGGNTKAQHIPRLRAIEGVEIVSVCNRSRESSERVAQEFGIPTVYENWLELVEAPDTDAIVIGTWPYLHAPVTLAAFRANKHVLCEARMAMTAREAHEMWEASRQKPHLVAQVVPSPFTLHVDATIQRLIKEGFLGEILAIDVQTNGSFVDRESPLHWRQNADLSGLNVLSLGIWYEAMMRWVGEATEVMAMGKVAVPLRKNPDSGVLQAVRLPDHVDVIAKMACGAQAHFGFSSIRGLGGSDAGTLFGSEGTLRFSEGKLFGGRRGDSALKEIPIPPSEQGGWRVEEEFIGAIRGKEKITRTSFEDGVKYMEFTEAVARSIAEKRAVSLPL